MVISECLSTEQVEAVWPILRQLRPDLDPGRFVERVRRARQGGYRLFAAFDDERAVGAIGFRMIDDLASGHSLYIDDLVVDEGHRGRGAGRRLMEHAAAIAEAEQCDAIRLVSALHREGAHRFYAALGFDRPGYVFKKDLLLQRPA